MSAPYPFNIQLDSHPYTGTWHLLIDGRLCVRSPWGSEKVDCCAGTRPEPLARQTLERIVRAHQRRRADELLHVEREMAKIRKRVRREGPHA